MRNLSALFFVAVLAAMNGCASKVDITAEKGKVKAVVDQFAQDWETKDGELLSRIMAHDEDMVNYGTDAVEHFVGWEAFREAVEAMFPVMENISPGKTAK